MMNGKSLTGLGFGLVASLGMVAPALAQSSSSTAPGGDVMATPASPDGSMSHGATGRKKMKHHSASSSGTSSSSSMSSDGSMSGGSMAPTTDTSTGAAQEGGTAPQ